MSFTKQANAEPIPGYRLIAPLGGGGFGEVWKCVAPGGLFKAIKFVYGNLNGVEGASTQAHEELQAIQHIKDIRHPFLLSIDRVESSGGELMIVTELADKSLHDVLVSYQKQGLPGIPREELLGYLVEAAEVLDLMNVRQGLQHLDVKPRNLFVVGNHVKVADFGLVTSLSGQDGIKLGAVTPLYASPEVFQGKASRSSDQYSLACTFKELLTGKLPFQGKNTRRLFMQHVQDEPDLSGAAGIGLGRGAAGPGQGSRKTAFVVPGIHPYASGPASGEHRGNQPRCRPGTGAELVRHSGARVSCAALAAQ